jgi:Ca2+-binding RTX toxin-like protein
MATIIGTEGPDTLTETSGVDSISGLGGDDTIIFDRAGGATETADGGAGSDRLVIDGRTTGSPVGVGSSSASLGGRSITHSNFEHFTVYHAPSSVASADGMTTGNGDDLYHYTAINDQSTGAGKIAHIYLGGGENDRIVIDGSGVTAFNLTNQFDGVFGSFWIGAGKRISMWQVERIDIVGGSLGDSLSGLWGNDLLDGRDGNDVLYGHGGDDRVIGGNGDDTLGGGGGSDVIVAGIGADTVDGGSDSGTSDHLEIDARTVAAAVSLAVSGSGPSYAGNFSWSAGSIDYSFIEGFIVYSNAGNFADNVATGEGDDVFHHYGINDLSYLLDSVDLGGGSNDLLVADFSAVTDHAVSNRVHPSLAGHYLFDVGGNGKIDYAGVERIRFIGGAQGDTVTGLAGADVLDGRAGNDTLTGGDGGDDIAGGTGTNSIDAGNGDDIVRSVGAAIDTVQGGAGSDTAIIDYSAQTAAVTNVAGGDIAFGNGGDTRVTLTGVERFVIATGSGADDITTLDGDDEIRTGSGIDTIDAGGGDDYLDGGSGADAMTGGDGDDTYIVDDAGDTITEASGEGTDLVHASSSAYVLPANVENLVATGAGAHSLRGNAGDNAVTGEAGNDFLLMQDGGADAASGLGGNDVIYFGAAYTGADHADGGAGRDSLVLQGNYAVTLSGSGLAGFESISLQSGANSQFGDVANNFYDFDITTADDLVAAGQQLIVNAQSLRAGEDFTFDGSAETDGKFLVYGGHGVDDLTGGAGVDVFFFEGSRWGAGDTVDGGAGRDALVISGGNGLTHIEFAADSFVNIESISLNNHYASDPTQKPSYELVLHNGNVASGGTLIVNGSSVPLGQVVNIDGRGVHDGNLILFGGGGHDLLFGGDGADLLIGGGGADSLTGGAGADSFRYDSASDSVAGFEDLIGDFQSGVDKFDLTRVDANANAGGNQAFTWIGGGAFSGVAGQLRSYEQGGYRWIAGDTDGDGDGDLVIALQPGTPLVQTDFLL